ncbi:mucin-2 isoform X12 [Drosophila biarmipes]|uniref:mucin-2 isoform X12 n=1 Tax=Drosophila biarmipes TaxID=125945 RepID=UPI0021CC6144|nr:mucin-2 isoform X12 [Drosophila biarmipes]
MEVPCKILTVCLLLVGAQAFEAIQPAKSSKELTWQSHFFDALTGNLQEPQADELISLEDCTALYTVDNIEILLTAGYKIRRCNNVGSRDIERYLEREDAVYTKHNFEGELISCRTSDCFVDTVLNLFSSVRRNRYDHRRRRACIIRELEKAFVKLDAASIALNDCLAQAQPQPPQNSTVPPPPQNTTASGPGGNSTQWPSTNTTPNFTTTAIPPWWGNNTSEGPSGNTTTLPPWWGNNTTNGPWGNNSTEGPWGNNNTTLPPWWGNNSTNGPWGNNSTEGPWGNNTTLPPWWGNNSTNGPWGNNSTEGPWGNNNTTLPPWWGNNTTVGPIFNSTTDGPISNTTANPWLGNSTQGPWNSTTADGTTTTKGNWFDHLMSELGNLF